MYMTAINFRMDDDLKRSFSEVCDAIGMSISTAFTVFAKKVVAEQGIPFDVKVDPFYSEENMAELRRRVKSIEDGTATFVTHDLVEGK